jgi:hypothetical protein
MNNSISVSQHSTEQSLDSLQKEKNLLRSQEKYIEANEVSKQIKWLKSRMQKERLQTLKSTYESDLEQIDQKFNQEVADIEQTWEESLSSYIRKCDKEVSTLVLKHSKKTKKIKEKLESEAMNSFKPSTGLLNMIRCKEQAVRQEKFVEAQALLQQIEGIRAEEEKRHADIRRSAIEQILNNLDADYDKKLQAMKKRHKTLMDEMNIRKSEEVSCIVRKFDNLKRELENSHKIRMNICEGRHTTSAGRHSQSPEKISASTLSPFRQRSLAGRSDL